MSAIRTNAAANMLGVSPSTLRNWERRFGYPSPRRSDGGHRQFELAEIEALQQAFEHTRDISSAVAIASERDGGPPPEAQMRHALTRFSAERADAILEESLSMRSIERTVESVLLPAIDALCSARVCASAAIADSRERPTPTRDAQAATDELTNPDSLPEYCFAWRYATGWLCAAQRLAPRATRQDGVLIFDASGPLDIDALYVQALELFLRRAGLRVLALPTTLHASRMGNALRALQPSVIVLAGKHASLDAIGRLVYTARQIAGDADVLDYRSALPDTGASTVDRLGPSPAKALQAVCERLSAKRDCALPAQSATGPIYAARTRRFSRARQTAAEADAVGA